MKKNLFVMALMAFIVLFSSCSDEESIGGMDNPQNDVEITNGIDMTPFQGLDEEILAKIRAINTVSTRAELPGSLSYSWDKMYFQEIDRAGEIRTLKLTGDTPYDVVVLSTELVSGEVHHREVFNGMQVGMTYEVDLVFESFYDSNEEALKICHIEVAVMEGDFSYNHIELFHMKPFYFGFSTDLIDNNYLIDYKGDTEIVITANMAVTEDYEFWVESDAGIELTPTPRVVMVAGQQTVSLKLDPNTTGALIPFEVKYRSNNPPVVGPEYVLDHGTQLALSEEVLAVENYYIVNFDASRGTAIVLLKFPANSLPSTIDPNDPATWPAIDVWAKRDAAHLWQSTNNYDLNESPKVRAQFQDYNDPTVVLYTYITHYDAYAEVPYGAGGPVNGWHHEWYNQDLAFSFAGGGTGYWSFHYNNLRDDMQLGTRLQTPWNVIVQNEQTTVDRVGGGVWSFKVSGRYKIDQLQFRAVNPLLPTVTYSDWTSPSALSGGNNKFVDVHIQIDDNPGNVIREMALEYRLSSDLLDASTPGVQGVWVSGQAPCQSWSGPVRVSQSN